MQGMGWLQNLLGMNPQQAMAAAPAVDPMAIMNQIPGGGGGGMSIGQLLQPQGPQAPMPGMPGGPIGTPPIVPPGTAPGAPAPGGLMAALAKAGAGGTALPAAPAAPPINPQSVSLGCASPAQPVLACHQRAITQVPGLGQLLAGMR